MSNKNWVCTACGRSFARRFSAQRHVNHLEGGVSAVIRKEQYEFGIKTGALHPRSRRPSYTRNNVHFLDLVKQKTKEKLANIKADAMLKDPQNIEVLYLMFMTESNQEQSKNSDAFSKWVAGNMGQY